MLAGLLWTGWPLTLVLAVMLAGRTRRQARRTERVNLALHELRRPLQALALGGGHRPDGNGDGPPPLDLAICALADVERAVDGDPALVHKRLLRLRPVVEDCVEGWSRIAELAAGRVELEWRGGAAAVVADPRRIVQALDNLVFNALEHGSPPIKLSVVVGDRGARISVCDTGTAPLGHMPRHSRFGRRGRGLEVVAAVAAEHGGRFTLLRDVDATRAVLELPLASLPLPALAGSAVA